MRQDLCALLRGNSYPGRGILLGRSGDNAVIAYFIMGRSENSRNRIFEETADGIRTRAFDESKMTDPSLIIYQTDTIRDAMAAGHCYRHGLHSRTFEPDSPNWTPRISGVVLPGGKYAMSILKSLDGDPACCCRYFFEYENPPAGAGHFISTYQGDGNPLPSFAGEPIPVSLEAGSPEELARALWESLNEDNKVSLFVRYIALDGGAHQTVIINKHGEGNHGTQP